MKDNIYLPIIEGSKIETIEDVEKMLSVTRQHLANTCMAALSLHFCPKGMEAILKNGQVYYKNKEGDLFTPDKKKILNGLKQDIKWLI